MSQRLFQIANCTENHSPTCLLMLTLCGQSVLIRIIISNIITESEVGLLDCRDPVLCVGDGLHLAISTIGTHMKLLFTPPFFCVLNSCQLPLPVTAPTSALSFQKANLRIWWWLAAEGAGALLWRAVGSEELWTAGEMRPGLGKGQGTLLVSVGLADGCVAQWVGPGVEAKAVPRGIWKERA